MSSSGGIPEAKLQEHPNASIFQLNHPLDGVMPTKSPSRALVMLDLLQLKDPSGCRQP